MVFFTMILLVKAGRFGQKGGQITLYMNFLLKKDWKKRPISIKCSDYEIRTYR